MDFIDKIRKNNFIWSSLKINFFWLCRNCKYKTNGKLPTNIKMMLIISIWKELKYKKDSL